MVEQTFIEHVLDTGMSYYTRNARNFMWSPRLRIAVTVRMRSRRRPVSFVARVNESYVWDTDDQHISLQRGQPPRTPTGRDVLHGLEELAFLRYPRADSIQVTNIVVESVDFGRVQKSEEIYDAKKMTVMLASLYNHGANSGVAGKIALDAARSPFWNTRPRR